MTSYSSCLITAEVSAFACDPLARLHSSIPGLVRRLAGLAYLHSLRQVAPLPAVGVSMPCCCYCACLPNVFYINVRTCERVCWVGQIFHSADTAGTQELKKENEFIHK